MNSTRYQLFCSVTPGLEPLLEEEVRALGITGRLRAHAGGVEVQVDREGLWTLACRSRLAESLRVRIGRIEARRFEALEQGLGRIPWHAWLPKGATPAVHAVCHKSALYHSGAVAERVVRAIAASQTKRGGEPTDDPTPTIHVRFDHDVARISVDASGELLHRRGWRTRVGGAPMRETLAAACLHAARLPPDVVLWDPFCGAGTIPIERLRTIAGLPTWRPGRSFAFETWPTHDAQAWANWRDGLELDLQPRARAIGSDIDPESIEAARGNAEAAGVTPWIDLYAGDFQSVAKRVPQGAAVVCNPPYGKRMGRDGMGEMLERFGRMLRRRRDLVPVAVLSGAAGFGRGTGLPWNTALRLQNRGLRVRLYVRDESSRKR